MTKIVKIVPLSGNITNINYTGTSYANLSTRYIWNYDSAVFDGTVNIYFEATGNSGGTNNVRLYDLTSAAAVTGGELTLASYSYTVSGDITANLTSGHDYTVQVKHTGSGSSNLTAVRMRIIQTNPTKTETVALTSGGDVTSASATYVNPNTRIFWNYDSSWFDCTVSIYFEASLSSTSTGTAYAELYNVTDLSSVAGSEVSVNSTTLTRVRSSAISLTSGKDYAVRIKTDNASYTTTLKNSYVILQQSSSFTKTESYYFGATDRVATQGAKITPYNRMYWDANDWDVSSYLIYQEGTFNSASATSTATMYLDDTGGSTASSIATTNTTLQRRRSTSISLTDNTQYIVAYATSAAFNIVLTGGGFLVQAVLSTGGANNYQSTSMMMGMGM